jgi:hypothetical protein
LGDYFEVRVGAGAVYAQECGEWRRAARGVVSPRGPTCLIVLSSILSFLFRTP